MGHWALLLSRQIPNHYLSSDYSDDDDDDDDNTIAGLNKRPYLEWSQKALQICHCCVNSSSCRVPWQRSSKQNKSVAAA